jgi:hypothetical protein
MTDEAAAGYYLIKWLSKPYTLHADKKGACPGLFPPGKRWSTRCTSTRYIAHKTDAHCQTLRR